MNAESPTKIALRSELYGDLVFDTPNMLREWIKAEFTTWNDVSIVSLPQSVANVDVLAGWATQGASQHAGEWGSFIARIGVTDDENIPLSKVVDVVNAIAQKLDARELILSTSSIGRHLLTLHKTDAVAARIGISLSSGYGAARMIIERESVPLWRAFVRIVEGISNVDFDEANRNASSTLKKVSLSAASISDLDDTARRVLKKLESDIAAEQVVRSAGLELVLNELRGNVDAELEKTKARCAELERRYKRQQALEAPRRYWQGRRTMHGIYGWVWGIVAMLSSFFVLKLLMGDSLSQLNSIRDKLKATDDQGHVVSWTNALPEIAVLAVGAFLILWALRFVVRQLAQHMARAEEAAQRVTMVKTFLALADYHEDGQPSLITEGDRALMIQALFRPGTLQSPEDGPPSHWIEDVLRRFSTTPKSGE